MRFARYPQYILERADCSQILNYDSPQLIPFLDST